MPQSDKEYYADLIKEMPQSVVVIQYAFSTLISLFVLCSTCINMLETFAKLDSMLIIKTNFYQASRRVTNRCLILMSILYVTCCILDLATDDEIMSNKIVL